MLKPETKIKKLVVGSFLTNCYILFDNEVIVIDPGGEIDDILREIKKRKLKYILNTHYHPDHIMENALLKEKTGAKILIHEKEKNFINFKPDIFLKEGDKIKIGETLLKVLNTPGHTKGSICLLGDNFIFTGDTLFKDGIGRTDLAGGSIEDIEKSLEKLSKIIKPGMMIYPGHGEVFSKK